MFKHVIEIVGMPRSGTSWLAQIFNSSPEVRFRMEPVFSYAFKNAVNAHSTTNELNEFFCNIYNSNDDFMRQVDKLESGQYPTFRKNLAPQFLVFKTTRFHNMLENILEKTPDTKIISIVRHPCGAINSWLKTPSEFPASSNPATEWRHGRCRNGPEEEFWGFNDWKAVTSLHLSLQSRYADNFRIVRYEALVNSMRSEVEALFSFCNLAVGTQTLNFIKESHAHNDDRNYSVYKSKNVTSKWVDDLPHDIINDIYFDLKGTNLNVFLEDQ